MEEISTEEKIRRHQMVEQASNMAVIKGLSFAEAMEKVKKMVEEREAWKVKHKDWLGKL